MCRFPSITRAQGYLAACGGIVASSASIVSGMIYARYGQGAYYAMAVMAFSGAAVMWLARRIFELLTPRARRPAGKRDCRRSAGRRRGRASATAGRQGRQSGLVGASSIAGAIASDVATMQPTMMSKPCAAAASAIASASVKSAGLVELDVDRIVALAKAGQGGAIMHAFVGADRNRPFDMGQPLHPDRPAAAARPA